MRPRIPERILILALFCALVGGCGWRYTRPPTAGGRVNGDRFADRPVVVVGRLANPTRARVPWKDIGSGMSEALAAGLRSESRYEATVDAPLAAQVRKLLDQVGERRARGLARLRKDHADVRFVVNGRVTDFAHSIDLPETLRRRGLMGRKKEAVVAIRFEVVDIDLGRVVLSDHIYGTSRIGGVDVKELYADMAFGSYLFWSTPLGKASQRAVDRAVDKFDDRLAVATPVRRSRGQTHRIARQTGPRTVQLAGDADVRSEAGQLYFVCRIDGPTGEHRAVFDPESGYPLKARIERPKFGMTTRTALLMGRKPPTVDIRGAVLCPVSPEDRASAE